MIQEQAEERMEKLTSQMAVAEGVTEQLKEADQMLWVAKMNNIQSRAEEVVLSELVWYTACSRYATPGRCTGTYLYTT